jgi:hypothetical protein
MKATPAVKRENPLSKTAALECAQRHLLGRMFKGARIRQGRFNASGGVADDPAWYIYPVLPAAENLLPPSFVLIVCQRTGKVLYSGPVNNGG